MRIAVLGARGQLGTAVVHECSTQRVGPQGPPAHDVVAFARADLDLTDDRAVSAAIERERPDAIVNCAANNHVDAAEDHPIDALNANAFAVRAIARAAERQGAALVHYGSDFVFDGTASAPYSEDDRPSPQSVYAASKLLGEWFALDAPRAYVLRVESLFGRAPGGGPAKGSVEGILNGLLSGHAPRVFEDRTVSPTFLADAARATRQLLELQAPPGVYHCVNSGACTWLELARELARRLGVEPTLTPVKMADVPLRAKRPQFCALSNDKLRRVGIDMPTWQDALARYALAATPRRADQR
jgi:dTDP-4-dehydrorhamnose reductase